MFVNTENVADIEKYFLKTYIRCRELSEDAIFYVNKVTGHEILLIDAEGNTQVIDLTIGYNIETPLPHKAVFQFENCAAYIHRRPYRKWKKGISYENTGIVLLGADGWGPLEETTLSFKNLIAFINKGNPFTFDGLEHWPSQTSYWLGSRWSCSNKGAIFIDDVRVGSFDKTTKKATMKKAFKEEFSKLNNGVLNVVYK